MTSQAYRHGQDSLSSSAAKNLFQSSFIKTRVQALISANPTGTNIKSTIRKNINNKDVFALQIYENNAPIGDQIMGDFPCPDQCIPPNQKEDFERTFNINHILLVMAYPDCLFLNIHYAFLENGTPIPMQTCAAYAVVPDGFGQPVARKNPGDNIFICIS